MSILNAQLHVGVESSYGSVQTPTISYPALDQVMSSHKLNHEYIEHDGIWLGMDSLREDSSTPYISGAVGTLPVPVLDVGMGKLFRAMFGSSAIAQQGATAAYKQTHESVAKGPCGQSLTVQLGRPPEACDATVLPETFLGGKVARWQITQNVGNGNAGLCLLELTMDYQTAEQSTALAALAMPAATYRFSWLDCVLNVNAAPVKFDQLTITGDNMLNTDRRYAEATAPLKAEPQRSNLAVYEVTIRTPYADNTLYNLVKAGTRVQIDATWTGTQIASPYNRELKITMPKCQLRGESPESARGNVSQQPIRARALDPATSATCTLEYTSTDTAI